MKRLEAKVFGFMLVKEQESLVDDRATLSMIVFSCLVVMA